MRALCERLVPGEIPEFVHIDVPPWAEANECIDNVGRMVEEYRGEAVNGWRLWEPLPDLMIEAEFHVVWRSSDGSLLDVSPHFPGFTQSVFLPDPSLNYEGQQIPNERVPLVDDTLIQAFIEALEAEYEAMNRGELADYHGPVKLTPEMKAIQARQQALFAQIAQTHY
jgi:hypothetical protein